jgi:hypothetical protein
MVEGEANGPATAMVAVMSTMVICFMDWRMETVARFSTAKLPSVSLNHKNLSTFDKRFCEFSATIGSPNIITIP